VPPYFEISLMTGRVYGAEADIWKAFASSLRLSIDIVVVPLFDNMLEEVKK